MFAFVKLTKIYNMFFGHYISYIFSHVCFKYYCYITKNKKIVYLFTYIPKDI